jgi:hypothetical protein
VATAQESVLVGRDQREVFDHLADPQRHHDWNLALLRTEMVDDGPVGVGTRAVEVRRMFGREMRSPFVITRHEPPNRQDFRTTGGPVRLDGALTCTTEGEGTRVSYTFTVHGVLGPVMVRPLRRGLRRNLANLRQVLEAR